MQSSEALADMNAREFQLLLCCAKAQPDSENIRHLASGGINWETLLRLAEQHRVRPLLFRTFKSLCWDAVPPMRQLELETFYKANVVQNLFATGELLRLLDAFRKEGITVAALKGAVLAQVLYGDLSLREFVDLDLFVAETDLCKAEKVLTTCGYRTYYPGREYRSTFLSYYSQQVFFNSSGISVDLHWRLASKHVAFPFQSAEVFGRVRKATIAGREIPTLADEDLAFFLAARGTKEGWIRLIWVCDFAEFLRTRLGIDWATVLDLAQRAHSSGPLLLAILLASALLDAPVPIELVDMARNNSTVQALAREAPFRMLRIAPEGDFDEFLNGLNTHDLMRHRLWAIVVLIMTRTVGDYEAMPLPKILWGMYYLTRPFRLAGRAVQMLLRNHRRQRTH